MSVRLTFEHNRISLSACHRSIHLPLPLNSMRSLCALSRTVTHRGSGVQLGVTMKTVEERFWSKVNKNGPVPSHMPHLGQCWEWVGCKFDTGYGRFHFNGKSTQASRFSYALKFGPLKQWALHKCDNRLCVNPDHIYDGDTSQNMADRKQRGIYYTRFNGHKKAKIVGEKYEQFEDMILGGKSAWSIAHAFGVHRSVAGKLARQIRKESNENRN